MWIFFAAAALAFVLIVGLLLWVVARRSRQPATDAQLRDERGPERWILLGGVLVPGIALALLLGVSIRTMSSLASPPSQERAIVEILAHRWWWEVNYPADGISSANHLVLPVGEPARVRVRSEDVIHSFWPPQLGGKLDALPDRWTTTWLEADRPGRYRGLCAEFCGLQHARMHFIVDVLSKSDYERWRERARRDAREPTTASQRRGLALFESHACAYCHTIRGTQAAGEVGPDLTHLASRPSLAAGTLRNSRGNLGGWIADPQHVKPGALMPPGRFTGSELQALLDYLESLR